MTAGGNADDDVAAEDLLEHSVERMARASGVQCDSGVPEELLQLVSGKGQPVERATVSEGPPRRSWRARQ